MTTILFVLLALLIISVITLIHELGHFLVGRKAGIAVVEFAVGIGPKLFGFEKNGTRYSLRAIPFGGYCSFLDENESSDNPRGMNSQPVWKRFLTVFAGAAFNFLLAFLMAVLLIANGVISNPYETQSPPVFFSVVEDLPAQKAGLMAGDAVTSVNGEALSYDEAGTRRLREVISACDVGDSVQLTVRRIDAETGEATLLSATLTPEYVESEGRRMVGVEFATYYAAYDCNYLTAIPEAFTLMGRTVVATVSFLKDLIVGIFRGQGVQEGSVSSVVGIVSTMSTDVEASFAHAFSSGIYNILYWVMVLSLNLGIMNLLPLPALDGGRLAFLIVEAVRRKPVNREREGMVHLIGLALLLILMIVVTYSDVASLIG